MESHGPILRALSDFSANRGGVPMISNSVKILQSCWTSQVLGSDNDSFEF